MAQAPKIDPTQSIAQAYTLADLINKHKADQDLRQALADPNAIDPTTGQISQNTLANITRQNPSAGMALQKSAADLAVKQSSVDKNKAQTKKYDFENGIKQMDLIAQTGGGLMTQYSNLLKQGLPPDQAKAQMQPLYQEAMQRVAESGQIDKEHLAQIPPEFDPDKVANGVFTALTAKDQFSVMHQQHQEELDKSKATETARHNRADEGLSGQRVGLESNRVGLEGQRLGMERERLGMEGAKSGLMPDPQNPGKFVKDPSAGLSDDDRKFMARQYLAGDKSVLQNLGRGAQGARDIVAVRRAIREEAEARGMKPDEVASTIAEFEGLKAGERSLGTRTAQAGMAVNEASQFADLALQSSQKVDRSKYPSLNKVLQAAEKGTGDPAIVQFGAYNNSLINAYARAISPSGTPTVSDKDHAREMLSTAYSKGQYAAVVAAMKQEMSAAMKSPGMVREEFRGYGKRQIGPDPAAGVPLPGQGPAPAGAARPPLPAAAANLPPAQNAQGWTLHKDRNGNMAYVSPDGKQFQQVQ
ncbi:hypothetical protein [Paraburkholderia rhynchosiae]|nr:hypothetical protein [Paraburkholderia rhynchosiae]